MRSFSSDIITKSAQTNQTIAADADPYVSLRIARAHTILDNMDLTEKVRVRRTDPNTITDADVAVQHPRFKGENSKIWVAYIRNGKLNVRWTYDRENITEMSWTGISTGKDAIACAIAFNSQVIENARGYAEFVSVGEYPYIFYVDPDGALHYLMLGGVIQDEILALENVTDVSAIRGPSAKYGSWDLGLTVFFLMGGVLYYRQCIEGIWYDAVQVDLTIPDETIIKIDAFNTWDYRVGVQALTQSGKLYQLITYTEGIGVRGNEHIEMSISTAIELTGITYHTHFDNEHIEMNINTIVNTLYGHSAIPISVSNVEDEDENWGTIIEVIFDYPNTIGTTTPNMFTLEDSNGIYYTCQNVALSNNGYKLILTFADFNLAARADSMTLTYTKPQEGGLMSPAVQTDSFTETFVPTGLFSPYNPPSFVSAWNSSDGMEIYVRFDEEITEGISDSNASSYGLSLHEYDYVPDGTLQNTTRSVVNLSAYEGNILNISGASMTDTEYVRGEIRLEVDE